jgi:hypothetical protein
VFTETVTEMHSKSAELQEEHAAAKEHLQSLLQCDQNPMYEKTCDCVAHLKGELKQIIKPKQSYYSPPRRPAQSSTAPPATAPVERPWPQLK